MGLWSKTLTEKYPKFKRKTWKICNFTGEKNV